MVELKSGKLVLKQKSISWDKTMPVLQGEFLHACACRMRGAAAHFMRCQLQPYILPAILGFNEYMSQQSETMAEVPDEYLHVIAKLTHER